MTRNSRTIIETVDGTANGTVDESWVAHLRDLSTGVVPPTSANPHAMSRVAIRRTRTRRAVLATGGGVMTVAAVAGAAFALGSPTAPGVLLPGGSAASASADPSMSAEERRARDVEAAAVRALESGNVPAGWYVNELEGLTYALPPEIVTSGPVQDEPGVTSDMWHSSEDPDSPPFLRMAYVTPDYEFYDTKAAGLTQTPGPDARSFDLPGASVATVDDSAPLSEIAGAPEADPGRGLVRILVHREDGPGRYIISMNLPTADPEFVEDFLATLALS
ncbi:hypothetical protein [Promicromonospora panici]|uniref:hypothetical protein n=1 Tax=Promicromonospora panici TaxID=2219658 RepID=UPI00101BE486|nr:hypothetical protein [Promicromonospora panici]